MSCNHFRANLEGETSAPFVGGVAEFTRLRVDRPEEELTLVFHTNPPRFRATTSVRFSVIAPPENTPRKRLGFILHGDLTALAVDSSIVLSSIRTGLGQALDVDISRIKDITYEVSPGGPQTVTDPEGFPRLCKFPIWICLCQTLACMHVWKTATCSKM